MVREYTKYEKARIIGSRALQISSGSKFLVKISDKELEKIKYNPVEIAKREFEAGVIPIDVKVPYPDTRRENGQDNQEKA